MPYAPANQNCYMKNALLLALGLVFTTTAGMAQAADFEAISLSGDTISLDKWLREGKTVIVDAMAVWCPPCWDYHQTGALKAAYDLYGPNGTDELRVIMIEADPSTPAATLRGGGNSIGDWTAGTPYPIINDDDFARDYGLQGYPTIYAIYPDRSFEEVARGSGASYQTIAQGAPALAQGVDVKTFPYTGATEFCDEPSMEIGYVNYGTETVAELDYTVDAGADGTFTGTIAGPFETYDFGTITIDGLTADLLAGGSVDLNVTVTGTGDIAPANNEQTVTLAPTFSETTDSLFVYVATDSYSVENAWGLFDGAGNLIFVVQYEGNANGGGADANQEFNYAIAIDEDPDCYEFLFVDSYGDGMEGYFTAGTDPIPGFRVTTSAGTEVVKVGLEGRGEDFGASVSKLMSLESQVSSVQQAPIAASLTAYPNPVAASDLVVVELGGATTGEQVNARLLNSLGQVVEVYSPRVTGAASAQLTFAIPAAATGVHFLELRSASGASTVRLTVE